MKLFNLIIYSWTNCTQLIIKKISIKDEESKFLTPLFISLQEVSTQYINGSKLGWHRYHSVEQNFYSSLCSSSKLILPVCCVHLFISTVTWLNYLMLLPSLNHLKSLLLLINSSKFPLWTLAFLLNQAGLSFIYHCALESYCIHIVEIDPHYSTLFIHLVLKKEHVNCIFMIV